jgi:hypothetical protein
MTDEYLTMCQEVWNCTRKHAQDAYLLTHMGVIVGLFCVKQREKERKEREDREKAEAEGDYHLEGGGDYDDYIDWEAQDRGN